MEKLIRALLKGAPAVSGITSHVNFGEHPQGKPYPYVVLWTIGDVDGVTLEGVSGFNQGRIQADCYGRTYGTAKRLSRAVKTVLSGYSGGALQGVFHAGSRESREGGTNEADRPFRVSLDFTLTYSNEEL